jgi:hypothetical protein
LREAPDWAKRQPACDERGLSGRHFTPKRRGDPIM